MSIVHELEEIVKGCNAANVEYALCGGLALVCSRQPTNDV